MILDKWIELHTRFPGEKSTTPIAVRASTVSLVVTRPDGATVLFLDGLGGIDLLVEEPRDDVLRMIRDAS